MNFPTGAGARNGEKKIHFTTNEAVRRFRAHALVEEKSHRDVVRVGLRDSVWTDLYHHALTASWPAFAYTAVISYFLINLFFAVLYWFAPDQVTGDGQHTLLSLFFFSVQTLSTVGYGGMAPIGLYANTVVSFEVLVGMMINALATGLCLPVLLGRAHGSCSATRRLSVTRTAFRPCASGLPTCGSA